MCFICQLENQRANKTNHQLEADKRVDKYLRDPIGLTAAPSWAMLVTDLHPGPRSVYTRSSLFDHLENG